MYQQSMKVCRDKDPIDFVMTEKWIDVLFDLSSFLRMRRRMGEAERVLFVCFLVWMGRERARAINIMTSLSDIC